MADLANFFGASEGGPLLPRVPSKACVPSARGTSEEEDEVGRDGKRQRSE